MTRRFSLNALDNSYFACSVALVKFQVLLVVAVVR